MNKKTYQTPSITVTQIAPTQMLTTSVNSIDGNAGIGYGGGGNGPARTRQRGGWDDDWDDEE